MGVASNHPYLNSKCSISNHLFFLGSPRYIIHMYTYVPQIVQMWGYPKIYNDHVPQMILDHSIYGSPKSSIGMSRKLHRFRPASVRLATLRASAPPSAARDIHPAVTPREFTPVLLTTISTIIVSKLLLYDYQSFVNQ